MTAVSLSNTLSSRDLGRVNACLDRQYNFDGQVMSLRTYIETHDVVGKHTYTQKYSNKRVNLAYKEINKTHYTLVLGEDSSGSYSIDIPKMVYDVLDVPVIDDTL